MSISMMYLPTCRLDGKSGNRRGGVYLIVVAVTMIVSTIGLSAIMVTRLTLDMSLEDERGRAARRLAAAAVENALACVNDKADWRTTFQNDVEYPASPYTLGSGTYAWKLVDDDGDLADDPSDSVELFGIGRVGSLTQIRSVTLQPGGPGLSALEVSLHCDGNLRLVFGANWVSNQIISSGGDVDATGLTVRIDGDVEAVGTISGNITGSTTSGITPRQMPSDSAFEYYLNNGTWIAVSSLPTSFGSPAIDRKVLSPTKNPYGPTTNPEGIYVIDCQGTNLQIFDCRITGTVVVLNPGPSAGVSGELYWEPAVTNYPCLLVEGNIDFWQNNQGLDETLLGRNFNPPGEPYLGVADNDTSDVYPSVIRGLVYVSGELAMGGLLSTAAVEGVVVARTMIAGQGLDLTFNPLFFEAPPPGFAVGPEMAVSPGSWKWAPSN